MCPWAALPDVPSMPGQSQPCAQGWVLGKLGATEPGPCGVPVGFSCDACCLADSRGGWLGSARPGADAPALAAAPIPETPVHPWVPASTSWPKPGHEEQGCSKPPQGLPGPPRSQGEGEGAAPMCPPGLFGVI